ncbi:MAG: DUF4276 family protein [Alcaligenaceae bacterium]|nr:MAG: DUF4276 family protein [Alcaligenaceae bacterium]
MRRVIVVCEGQTEEAFVSRLLTPAFLPLNMHIQGITVQTSPGHKGGALNYDRLLPTLRNALAGGSVAAVSTFIDLYKLDTGFPGFDAAAPLALQHRLDALENALHADVVGQCGCDPARFVPHIQPHEFEALLFSDVQTLIGVEAGWDSALLPLLAARAVVATPEDINHGPATKPAAQLGALLQRPNFRKVRHGPIAAERIGLARIEAECPRFALWLTRLRALIF